jgi:hypothetical protein
LVGCRGICSSTAMLSSPRSGWVSLYINPSSFFLIFDLVME